MASVVGNLLTNRPFEHGFMVLQENYDLGIRQTSVVIGRNGILADHKVANSGFSTDTITPQADSSIRL